MRTFASLSLATVVALGIGGLVAPVSISPASAALEDTIVDSPLAPVFDATVGPDGTTYAVGNFTQVGAATGGLALLDGGSGLVDRTFPTVNGEVLDTVTDDAGRTYLAGDFVSVDGTPRSGLARLNPDGSVDQSWAPLVDGPFGVARVYSVLLDDTALLFGGSFNTVNGETRGNLAAIDTETGGVLPWSAAANAVVYAMAMDDTHVYAGGNFGSISFTPRVYVAAFDRDDLTLDPNWNPGANSTVNALAAGDGSVYLGGEFTQVGTNYQQASPRSKLAALDANTGAVTAWDPAPNGSISKIVIDDTLAYITGNFTQINGSVPFNRAAALRTDDTGTVTGWDPNLNANVTAIMVADSHVYLGGSFGTVNGNIPRPGLVRVDKSSGTLDAQWNPAAPRAGNYTVFTFALWGGDILAGGSFTHLNVIPRSYAAAFDSNMRVTAWDPSLDGEAYGIEVAENSAYVIGNFASVNGSVPRDYAAAFHTDDTGTATAWDPQLNSYPYDIDIHEGVAYLVGDFGNVDGSTRSYAAAVSIGDAATVTPWDPELDSAAFGVAVDGDVAYVVGEFTDVNAGTQREYVAAFDTSDGEVTPWDPRLSGSTAHGIAIHDGVAYIVGDFNGINGNIPRANAAAVSVDDTGTATEWDPDVNGTVYDVAVTDFAAYLHGDFTALNGGAALRSGLAAVSITDSGTADASWVPDSAEGFSVGASYEGNLTVAGDRLLVAGDFVMVTLNGVDYPGGLAALPIPFAPTPPAPAPEPIAASAPRDVEASAEDRSASVSWSAPASTGSFVVSTYQVTSSPGGRVCLTSTLFCKVQGLINGTEYTFTVRALNGAGWSPESEPSNAVTPVAVPRPSVTITGTRDGKRIELTGTTTGFGMGGTLRPWLRFPGQSRYTEGSATILVTIEGTFEWGRRSGKRVSVYVQTPDGSVRSNTVTIAGR